MDKTCRKQIRDCFGQFWQLRSRWVCVDCGETLQWGGEMKTGIWSEKRLRIITQACLLCWFWSVREGVLLMVNLASYYGLNLSLLFWTGGQLIKLNDPDIFSRLKDTVIQFDIDLCEVHIVKRRPRLNRVFWYSERKIYRCWTPCTHFSLQALNPRQKDLRKHILKEK